MHTLSRSLLIAASLALPLAATTSALADSSCDAVTGNLIVNCGFETGDFTGWNENDPTYSSGVDGHNPNSGIYAASLGATGPVGTLSQTVTDTAGTSYNLNFFLENETAVDQYGNPYPGIDSLEISVTNDLGQSTDLLAATSIAQSSSYDPYNYLFTGSGSDTITFTFENQPSYYDLDDVSVVAQNNSETSGLPPAVPEPSSLVLMGTGVLSAAGLVRRRFQPQS